MNPNTLNSQIHNNQDENQENQTSQNFIQDSQYNLHITSNHPISKSETNYRPLNPKEKNTKNQKITKNENKNKLDPLLAKKIDSGANIPYNLISRPTNDIEDYDDPNKVFHDLQNYKLLCEQMIKKLKPDIEFPITRQDLYTIKIENKNNDNNESNESDNYSELEQNYNDVLEALKKQTLINDEQRSYIEVLKQTLESNLVKHGLSSLIPNVNNLNESKSIYSENGKFYSPKKLNDLIDLSKLTSENEKIKDEIIKQKIIIKDLTNQLEQNKKDNQDLQNMNVIFKEKVDQLKLKGENINKELLKSQKNNEKDIKNIEELKDENYKLKDNLNEAKSLVNKYENEINDNGKTINELNQQLSNLKNIENKYEDTKELYDKLEYDHNRLLNDKIVLDDKNKKLNEKITQLKEEKEILNQGLENNKIQNEEEKKRMLLEKEDLILEINKAKEEKNSIEDIIHEKAKIIVS